MFFPERMLTTPLERWGLNPRPCVCWGRALTTELHPSPHLKEGRPRLREGKGQPRPHSHQRLKNLSLPAQGSLWDQNTHSGLCSQPWHPGHGHCLRPMSHTEAPRLGKEGACSQVIWGPRPAADLLLGT